MAHTVGQLGGTPSGSLTVGKLHVMFNDPFKFDGKLTAVVVRAAQAGNITLRVKALTDSLLLVRPTKSE